VAFPSGAAHHRECYAVPLPLAAKMRVGTSVSAAPNARAISGGRSPPRQIDRMTNRQDTRTILRRRTRLIHSRLETKRSSIQSLHTISDPRQFPISSGPPDARSARWIEWAESSLAAATGQESAVADVQLQRAIVEALGEGGIACVESALGSAPSAVVYRHLLRAVQAAWASPALDRDADVVTHGFAIPVVIVAAAEAASELPMIVGNAREIEKLLKEHRCLAGNQNFAVANVLAGSAQVGIRSLSRWTNGGWRRLHRSRYATSSPRRWLWPARRKGRICAS
jgi:hypothetical protein